MIQNRIGCAADFDDFYHLLEESFPTDEYRDMEGQRTLLHQKNYKLYLMKKENTLLGAAAVWMFENFVFLEHLAVRSDLRGKGLGTELLLMLRHYHTLPMCLEVELPETEIAKRRIDFYQRCGFVYNTYEYIQPAFSQKQNPVPLRIMSSGSPLNESQFYAIKATLYRDVYHVEV